MLKNPGIFPNMFHQLQNWIVSSYVLNQHKFLNSKMVLRFVKYNKKSILSQQFREEILDKSLNRSLLNHVPSTSRGES